MKSEHPRITAADIHRNLLANGSIHLGQLSVSTVERYVRLIRKEKGMTNSKDMRRYERPHINEVWYGDTCFGPYIQTPEGKKRVYFIALIDDASRFIIGADIFFNDNFENLMCVIRSAVSKYGRPRLFSFDMVPVTETSRWSCLLHGLAPPSTTANHLRPPKNQRSRGGF